MLKVDVKLYKIIWNGYGLLGEVAFSFLSAQQIEEFFGRVLLVSIAYNIMYIIMLNLVHFMQRALPLIFLNTRIRV